MTTRPRLVLRSGPAPCTIDPLEGRTLRAADLRTYDGSSNNLAHADWGAAGSALLRMVAAAYSDGAGAATGSNRPSARAISNAVAAHPADAEILSATHLSAFSYLWGQFVDHDLDLTTSGASTDTLNVPVPTGDAWFDPLGTGTQVIPLTRSKFATGTGVTTPRQQVNDITAYLDGSMIYSSDATRALALRTLVGGLMKTSAGSLLPLNTMGLANANDAHLFAADQLYAAGDVRANENSELTALQTLFVREHNRLAGQIAVKNPTWSDEQIYQQARRLVIGEVQNITYNEYLPALLGPNAIGRYNGYDPRVNAGVTNEFSTAAFRLGHSQLVDDVEFLNNDGTDAADDMSLAEVFFNPTVVARTGIDPILKYLASSNAEEIDTKVVDSLRNFLFGPPGSGGLDLASLNIQRGRDHGLADYNTTRAALGLGRVTSFAQITSDPTLAATLQTLYGSVNNVDLWVGGLAEDHVAGSNLGATFQRIVVDQFQRTRAGDRFWYERDLSGADLSMVRGMTLASLIATNTTTTNLQANVFVFDVSIDGVLFNDQNANGRNDREPLIAGVALSLLDADGTVVATTRTDRNGHYAFSSVQIGTYTVAPTPPTGQTPTAAATAAVAVSKGGAIHGVDFGLRAIRSPIPPPPPRGPDGGPTRTRASIASDVLM